MRYALSFILALTLLCATSCYDNETLLRRGLSGENLYELEVFGEKLSTADVRMIELHGFKVEDFLDDKVQSYIRGFQTTGRAGFQAILDRSQIYLPYIKEVFRAEGIPEDLAYLPIIESSFISEATSRSGAVGLWQFMPRTGIIYGLAVDYWVDMRRDPEKSTVAAAKHLKRLNDNFKNWALSLAAYNAGGGRISRAIKKHKSNNYWDLVTKPDFPKETKNYIPKFIAAVMIAKNPSRYGFTVNAPEVAFPNYDKAFIDDAADIKIVAEHLAVDVKTLRILNPELKQWITPPKTKNYPLRIPQGTKETFDRTFGAIPQSERVTFRRHEIRSGETLSHISAFYNVPISALKDINPSIKNPRLVNVGMGVLIPIRGLENAKQIDMKDYQARMQREREGRYVLFRELPEPDYAYTDIIYCVGARDSLWDIALKYKVSMEEIRAWNGLTSSVVREDDELFIRVRVEKN